MWHDDVLLTECCQGDQIREAEMGRACGMYETQEMQQAMKPSDLDVESSIALKQNMIGWTGRGLHYCGSGWVAGCCEDGDERSGSINCGVFFSS